MKLDEMVKTLALDGLTPQLPDDHSVEIKKGYVSDLLSDVLANAPQKGVLVTAQVHMNVIAVAVHADLAAVIFPMDRAPDDAVRAKAVEEGIRLYRSPASAFDLVGRLHDLGLRGPNG